MENSDFSKDGLHLTKLEQEDQAICNLEYMVSTADDVI
jgi:hypothetical protein